MEVQEMLPRRVARFVDRVADWDAFADARTEGYRRAQHRFIGVGASGKNDAKAIPADHFTLSIMYVPPGQGNAAHTHPVEEAFFILEGKVKVFLEDGKGARTSCTASRTSASRARISKSCSAPASPGSWTMQTRSSRRTATRI